MLSEPEPLALISATHDVLAEELGRLSPLEGGQGGLKRSIPEEMARALDENIFLFSGFKTWHEMNDASRLLKDEDGGFKSFDRFLQDVKAIDAQYNQNWLYAEYNFATASTQMAAKWADIERDGDEYDLQYRTALDGLVRPEHAALEGITLPPSDKFWNEYYPPNGWNCRCTAVQVLKDKYPTSDSDQACAAGERATTQIGKNGQNKAAMFRFNPGKAGKVFPPKHPYYKAPAEVKKKVNAIVATLVINPKTDTQAFRALQKQARQALKQNPAKELSGERYYSKHLYFGKDQKDAVVSHCYWPIEIEAAKQLETILPTLKDGKYQPIDMSRGNYKKKQEDGVLHFTVYEFEYDGRLFELKCEAVKKKGWRNVVEMPYSLKEKSNQTAGGVKPPL